jgi:hypothetical protein
VATRISGASPEFRTDIPPPALSTVEWVARGSLHHHAPARWAQRRPAAITLSGLCSRITLFEPLVICERHEPRARPVGRSSSEILATKALRWCTERRPKRVFRSERVATGRAGDSACRPDTAKSVPCPVRLRYLHARHSLGEGGSQVTGCSPVSGANELIVPARRANQITLENSPSTG